MSTAGATPGAGGLGDAEVLSPQTLAATRKAPKRRGRTRVRCVAYGFPGGPMGYALRSLLDRGAVLALDQLRKAAETQKPRRG